MEFKPDPSSKLEGRLPNTESTWNIAHAANGLMTNLDAEERRHLAALVSPETANEKRNLERRALTDNLTQLANREAFDLALQTAEADPGTSIIFFDGDKFGLINKKLGQSQGDLEIKRMAGSLKGAAANHGVGERVFRIGGDEFAILASTDDAEAVRNEAVNAFGTTSYEGFKYQGHEVPAFNLSLTGAIGLTFFEAESKLVQAKAQTGNERFHGESNVA